ncbi:L-2-hydroxyglutarate oxidase [Simiduia sp. 21SJ11W-1]|uniref:L-2-hydroxyglutarate oxidase n=1 Tax=Simiduia sp. 21SJ11W-1 TaxID=2909669 RepID=UPI00209FE67D|nr:L-2-hydroxyglutarate oxidase [Simiduia sp. 21SJ11W-1]UTA46987.1 L-2-hydroxyglutarate oxidase [Simiduia sp. 21SJ11W-1]
MKIGIVGAGIIGAATARAVQQRWPRARVWLLDKEAAPALHQTGRNSGVIHAGVYYPAQSLKARFCRFGLAATYHFAASRNIPHRRTGKLIVATHPTQQDALENLAARATGNGLSLRHLNAREVRDIEPAIQAVAALRVDETGIVDYPALVRALVAEFEQAGGRLWLGAEVSRIDESDAGVTLALPEGARLQLDKLVVCAGLQADRLIAAQGLAPDFAIVPFRGEYYRLRKGAVRLNHLIYPVPDSALPFLGVHLTPMVGGEITAGPNAVLGLHREGYTQSVRGQDVWDLLRYPGLWRLAAGTLRAGARELRDSLYKRGYLARLQAYCPGLTLSDLQPWPVGIRAQAVTRKGELVQDFHFMQSLHCLHVCSAPSPAATAAFPIAEHLVEKMEPWFL